MNGLKIFENKEFGQVKTIIKDNEPWFIGKNIAEILGYTIPTKAVATHVDEEDRETLKYKAFSKMEKAKTSNNKDDERLKYTDCSDLGTSLWIGKDYSDKIIINESGLYSLILSSKLPTAKKFKRWVTSEVLPSIRKTGTYEQKKLGPMEMLELQFSALKEQKEKIKEHDERLSKIEDLSEVTTGQAVTIKKTVDKKVYEALNDSYYDKEIRNRTYKKIWKDYKGYFCITSYHCTLKKDFEEAIEIVQSWKPQGELARDIDLSKRQMVY